MRAFLPASKNEPLTKRGGIGRLSRTQVYKAKTLYKRKKLVATKKAVEKALTKKKPIGGDGNGGFRMVPVEKAPRFYPTEDRKVKVGNHKANKTAALRESLTPGTVVILLSGRFRGKRVVFLGQLPSGMLLVTGPYAINGVPMKRVDQTYVIATSTKVDLGSFSIPAEATDAFFAKPASAKKPSGEFFEKEEAGAKTVDPARAAIQKTVDAAVSKAVDAVPMLKDYMRSLFSLGKGQYPHQMKF